jgi:putative transposase
MTITTTIRLQPTQEQEKMIRDTVCEFNKVCNYLSERAWFHDVFRQFDLHKLCYHDVRTKFNLSAQSTVRAIAKVADAYKLDKKVQRKFSWKGAATFDTRILRFLNGAVSIWTVAGRQKIPFACSIEQAILLQKQKGECDLLYRNGKFLLSCCIEVGEAPHIETRDVLGVDVGCKNLVATSDGHIVCSATLNGTRARYRKMRRKLQKVGTKSAKRLLKKRNRRETLFSKDVNHQLSKAVVALAQGTNRAVALEDLTGIRTRITARRNKRAGLTSWAFYQFRAFVEYKAKLKGVQVVTIDPRNTSRTCVCCGHCEKSNRKSQSKFVCIQCGYSAHADIIGAENIRRKGLLKIGLAGVNQPYAATAVVVSCKLPALAGGY